MTECRKAWSEGVDPYADTSKGPWRKNTESEPSSIDEVLK